MKHRNNRVFWSAIGAVLTGEKLPEGTQTLPAELLRALEKTPVLPDTSITYQGEDLPGKRGRYIYTISWNTLREMGFQRPLRIRVQNGLELLAPFFKNSVAVIPQGFQNRVPGNLRALALVGKSAAFRQSGYHLIVCSAVYIPEVWELLQRGKCSVCTPDKLVQLVNTLDFSH